jgi:hypothetical protein
MGAENGLAHVILTSNKNLNPDGIDCAMCGKLLSCYDSASDTHEPPCEQLMAEGKVPVPNFGWFCGQGCASAYEREFGVHFQRDAEGKVEYYAE